MDKKRIGQIKEQFDLVIHSDETANIEFWFARELMPLLGYERWENFAKAINRAMESCETSGIEVSDHFREVTKMIVPGSGSTGKSGTICRIPDSSDLKSPIRCTGHKSALCTLRKRERSRRAAQSHSEPRTLFTVYRSAEGCNSFAWEEESLLFRQRLNLSGIFRDFYRAFISHLH